MAKPFVLMAQPNIYVNGGAERQLAELANWLTDHNYRVTLMTASAIPEFKKSLKETRIIECGSPQGVYSAVTHFQHKFEIYNPHNHPTELFNYRLYGFPNVWQCNEPPDNVLHGQPLDPKDKMVVNDCVNKIVVISEYNKKWIKQLYGMDSVVNYPGIRYDYFSEYANNPPKDKWGIWNGEPELVLLQTGYIVWTKNQLKSLDTLVRVKKDYPHAKLVLAGFDKDPDYVPKVRKRISDLHLEESVLLLPYVQSDSDFRELYRLCDVFINPVLEQGGYATTFEAISAGMPTVVSENFVASNLVKENKLGIVSSMDNFEESVVKAIGNKKLREDTMISRTWIRDNLTWNKFGETYDKVFHEVYEFE